MIEVVKFSCVLFTAHAGAVDHRRWFKVITFGIGAESGWFGQIDLGVCNGEYAPSTKPANTRHTRIIP
jgi:hypothetical protein